MGAEELAAEVLRRVRELAGAGGEDPAVGEVFSEEVLEALAGLGEDRYEKFKLVLEAEMLLAGLKVAGLTERGLDRLVEVRRLKAEEERPPEPPVPLVAGCPDAPDGAGLLAPGGWDVRPESLSCGGELVCAGAVYVAGRLVDPERARTHLRLVAFADGEWRSALVPASASLKSLVRTVRELGVLVYDEDVLAGYLKGFLSLNWARMSVARVGVDEDSLFTAFQDFVAAHWQEFAAERWGRVIRSAEGDLLAVKGEVLERFCRSRGASFRQVLSAWRAQGWLATGGLTRPVRLGQVVRRAPVFPVSLFGVVEGAAIPGHRPRA